MFPNFCVHPVFVDGKGQILSATVSRLLSTGIYLIGMRDSRSRQNGPAISRSAEEQKFRNGKEIYEVSVEMGVDLLLIVVLHCLNIGILGASKFA
jgi:hypothetical protein